MLHHTKRKYQEKRHLVKNLEQTETILTQQANELLNVANIASNDAYRLHDTMARRKEIDQHIEVTKEKLQQAMQIRFQEMSEIVEQLQTSNSKYSMELIQDICEYNMIYTFFGLFALWLVRATDPDLESRLEWLCLL